MSPETIKTRQDGLENEISIDRVLKRATPWVAIALQSAVMKSVSGTTASPGATVETNQTVEPELEA